MKQLEVGTVCTKNIFLLREFGFSSLIFQPDIALDGQIVAQNLSFSTDFSVISDLWSDRVDGQNLRKAVSFRSSNLARVRIVNKFKPVVIYKVSGGRFNSLIFQTHKT